MQPLAVLRSHCCPKCQEVAIEVDFTRLVLGAAFLGDPQRARFIEDHARTLIDDNRVRRASMAGTTYITFPKGYPPSIAIKHAGEHGPTYQVIYQAAVPK